MTGPKLSELSCPWAAQDLPPTPFYLYSEQRLDELFSAFQASVAASGVRLHFALKSNNHPGVLDFFRRHGAGLDLVSGGEYAIARKNGFAADGMIFSGVGKSRAELKLALNEKISMIIVESRAELETLLAIAAQEKTRAPIALRVNPDVDAKTHPYITTGLFENKFGVDFDEAEALYRLAHKNPWAELKGISVHIGSQMLDLSALESALSKTIDFCERLQKDGITLRVLDVGGGLGVPYAQPLEYPPFKVYGDILTRAAGRWRQLQGTEAACFCEIGRALVAQAGLLVTRVIRSKKNAQKNFVIVDASMTELLRPALYQAQHPISLWKRATSSPTVAEQVVDVVGPVCESADFLGRSRLLPELFEGDVLCIECAGAYGAVLASQYNGRPLPREWWWPRNAAPRLL